MDRAALRSQFKALLNRNDCTNALADTFIDQALARIQRTLRVPAMEKAASITFTESLPSSFILPTDFLEFIDLYYEGNSGSTKVTQVALADFLKYYGHTGVPQVYTRFGPEVRVAPTPSQGVELVLTYYAEFADFTDDTSSNFLSESCPDLLIYAALSYASDYFVDDRKQSFEDSYVRIYQEIDEQARSMEFSGGSMGIQPLYNIDY